MHMEDYLPEIFLFINLAAGGGGGGEGLPHPKQCNHDQHVSNSRSFPSQLSRMS